MSAVERSYDPAVVGAHGFADEVEAAVCCGADEGAVKVGELAGAELPICTCSVLGFINQVGELALPEEYS